MQKLVQIHIAYYLAYTQSWGTLESLKKSEFKLNPFAVSLKLWKQLSFSISTFFATQAYIYLPYSLPLKLSFSNYHKAGFLSIFFSKLEFWTDYSTFLLKIVPEFSVSTFISFYHRRMGYCLMISKKSSYHSVNKNHMQIRFYIIWKFGPWIWEYQIAIRFSELNGHLRYYQMGPVHDWGPCLISVNRLWPEFFPDEMFTV